MSLLTPPPIPPEVEEIGHQVIGCAITVHRILGPGFKERIYQRAFCLELEQAGLSYECEKRILVPYKGFQIEGHRIDLIIAGVVIGLLQIPAFLIIETALGMANVEAIAQSSKRVEAMSFGVADYAASTRARTMGIGAPHPDYGILSDKDGDKPREFYWNDPWHYALSRMMVACRAYGLRPIDGPFGDFSDPDGYTAAAKRAAVLGFEGKWAIHPSQVELANTVFTPSEAEVTKAKRIVEAMKQAAKEGKGAVSLDGRLIDIASIRQAEALLNKAAAMGM